MQCQSAGRISYAAQIPPAGTLLVLTNYRTKKFVAPPAMNDHPPDCAKQIYNVRRRRLRSKRLRQTCRLYGNRFRQVSIHIVSGILDRNNTAAPDMGDHRNRFPAVTAQRKEKRSQYHSGTDFFQDKKYDPYPQVQQIFQFRVPGGSGRDRKSSSVLFPQSR